MTADPVLEDARKAEALRKLADGKRREAEESFERSDTDGFVSQWASRLNARLLDVKAALLEEGGQGQFPALFDGQGRRVAAKLVQTRFGMKWMVVDAAGEPVAWVTPRTKSGRMAQLGWSEGEEMAPATVEIRAHGTGLSGAASATVEVVRTDDGYPEGSHHPTPEELA